jgi:ABC-type uncharacterized transport system substrate-binding protein
MKHIEGLLVVLVALAACGARAEAQQPTKVPRIGYVSATGNSKNPGPLVDAFRQGLRDLGYVESNNILVEYRYVEGNTDAVPSLVGELVQLKVDVLVLGPQPAIRAAKQATKTIPIVMVTSQDPVVAGFVDSLARPGGNITGLTRLTRELSGKRLELLKEAVPGISRVGALVSARQTGDDFKWYEAPARALKIQLQLLEVQAPNPDFDAAFQAAAKGRASALITLSGGVINRYPTQIAHLAIKNRSGSVARAHRPQVLELAIKNRLPAIYGAADWVEDGGLVAYGVSYTDLFRRAATYVDKILKGAKPAELPVEQPTKFEFVINLKAAKQIGLNIPQWTLVKADKVIR